jgi:hypothetical protein
MRKRLAKALHTFHSSIGKEEHTFDLMCSSKLFSSASNSPFLSAALGFFSWSQPMNLGKMSWPLY